MTRSLGVPALALSAALVSAGAPGTPLAERIEAAATTAARAAVAPPDRLDVTASRFAGADPVVDGPDSLEVEAIGAEGPDANGVVRVRFRLSVGGTARGEARAVVRGVVRGPAVVATRAIARGRPVDAAALRVEDADLTRAGELPLRSIDQAAGRVAAAVLVPGRAVTSRQLRSAPAVRRGASVVLRFEGSGFVVAARGTARCDGAPGETVAAVNNATGARVQGRVQPDGSLLVSGDPSDGRTR